MWHYVRNGQSCGPIDLASLQTLFQTGSLGMETLVWQMGMQNWAPGRTVKEFASAQPSATPPPVPPISMPPPLPAAAMSPDQFDIEHNKVFAVLAYLGILFLVPLLAAPNSRFARYHTNQGIVLFLTALVLSVCSMFVTFIPLINLLLIPWYMVFSVTTMVFVVLGIVHAASGLYKPLPLIGHFRLLN